MESMAVVTGRRPDGGVLARTVCANMKRANENLQDSLNLLSLEQKRQLRRMNRDAAQVQREMCRLQVVSTERCQRPQDVTSHARAADRIRLEDFPKCAHAYCSLPRCSNASDAKHASLTADRKYVVTKKTLVHDIDVTPFPPIAQSGDFGKTRHRSRSMGDAHACAPVMPRRSTLLSTELRRVSVKHRMNLGTGRRKSSELGGCHDGGITSSRDALSFSASMEELKHCRYLRIKNPFDEMEESGL
ncbi:hypothetical protein LSAT2_007944 [Lamellibrachia satsuma]|nr:hypothetical protein LSAT2_007944 [Lamellibrachia satsuma]